MIPVQKSPCSAFCNLLLNSQALDSQEGDWISDGVAAQSMFPVSSEKYIIWNGTLALLLLL